MLPSRDVPLVRREALAGDYRVLSFRHPELAAEARPGQFVMIKAGRSSEPPLRRPFSILGVDRPADTFTLFIKVVGQGTRALDALSPGETAQCLGPLGRPFPTPSGTGQTLLVAGGYGVAPFLLLSEQLDDSGRRLRVFYGGRSSTDLPLVDRFAAHGVDVIAATEDGSLGHRGRVTEPLVAELDTGDQRPTLYACGPEAMLHAVARIAAERGLEARVSLDPWMGCGFGTCLACVVDVQRAGEPEPRYRCACTEGPVFDAAEVLWPGETRSHAAVRAAKAAS